jgi:hypothetical protein
MTVETSLTVIDRGRSKSHWLGAEGLASAREVNIERAFKHGFLLKDDQGRNPTQVSELSTSVKGE